MIGIRRLILWLFLLLGFLVTSAIGADQLVQVKQLSLPGTQSRILKKGSYAYLAAGTAGVNIVDVSVPASAMLLSTLDTAGSAQGLAFAGTTLCVADGIAGLLLVDVSNPAAPHQVGIYDTPGTAQSVITSGTLAYVADGNHGLQIIDVSNPARPSKVGSFDQYNNGNLMLSISTDSHNCRDVALWGQYALMTDGLRMWVVNIQDPKDPVLVGQQGATYDEDKLRFFLLDGQPYLSWSLYSCRMNVLDFTYMGFPAIGNRLACMSRTYDMMGAVKTGDLMYLAEAWHGVDLIDWSIPAAPVSRGHLDINGRVTDLAVEGDMVYVANGTNGMVILRRQPKSFLHPLAPASNSTFAFNTPIRVRWSAENLTGNLSIKASYSTDGTVQSLVSSVAVSQGATGCDVTIAPVDSQYGTKGIDLILESADHQTTVALPINLYIPNTINPLPLDITLNTPQRGVGPHQNEYLISGRAQDEKNGIAKVELRVDGGSWSATTMASDYTFRKAVAANSGNHTVEVRAQNTKGTYTAVKSVVVCFSGSDLTSPRIIIDQPHDQDVLTGHCTFNISGSALDEGTTRTGAKTVHIEFNSTVPVNLSLPAATTQWSTPVRLAHGQNSVIAYCIDNASNYSSAKSLNIFYDPALTTPTCAITSPPNAQVVSSTSILVSGTATGHGAPIDLVEVRVNGGTWSLAQGAASWSAPCTLVAGYNTIEVRATDANNYISAVSSAVVFCQLTDTAASPLGVSGGDFHTVRMKGSLALLAEGTHVRLLDLSGKSVIRELASINMNDAVYDIALDGNLAYLAANGAGLQVYDISDPAHPRWLGGHVSGYLLVGATVVSGYAYVISTTNYLIVYDVSTPGRPRRVGNLSLPVSNNITQARLTVSGSSLFVSSNFNSMQVVDITSPSNPFVSATCPAKSVLHAVWGNTLLIASNKVLSVYDVASLTAAKSTVTFADNIIDLQLRNNHLFVLLASGLLQVYDAGDLASQVVLGSLQASAPGVATGVGDTHIAIVTTQGLEAFASALSMDATLMQSIGGFSADRVRLSGSRAVVQSASALKLYDISNPQAPQCLSLADTLGQIQDYAIQGDELYAVVSNNGYKLLKYNLNNGTSFTPVGLLTLTGQTSVSHLLVSGNRAYLTGNPPLRIFDISSPTTPTLMGQDSSAYSSVGIGLIGSIACVGILDYYPSVSITNLLDVSNAANPHSINMLGLESLTIDVATTGSCAYVLFGSKSSGVQGLNAYNLTNPARPVTLPKFTGLDHLPLRLKVAGPRLFVFDTNGSAFILDVDGQSKFSLQRRLPQLTGMVDADVSGNLLAVACGSGGFKLFDLSALQPNTPLGSFGLLGAVTDVAAAGDTAWVIAGGRLCGVDISNPDQPCILSTWTTAGTLGRPRLIDGRIYLPVENGSQHLVAMLDAADPAHPVLLGYLSLTSKAYDVNAYGNIVYVGQDNVLAIFDCTNPASPVRLPNVRLSKSGSTVPGYIIERSGAVLMVAVSYYGLQFFDASNPRTPIPTLLYYGAGIHVYKPNMGFESEYPVTQAAVDDHHVVLTNQTAFPVVVKFHDAYDPLMIYQAPSSMFSYTVTAASGGRIALATMATLNLYRMLGDSVVQQGTWKIPADLKRMAFANKVLCLATGKMGLTLLRVNLPASAVKNWQGYK